MPFGGHLGAIWVTWGPFESFKGHSEAFWCHLGHLGAIWGPFWDIVSAVPLYCLKHLNNSASSDPELYSSSTVDG